jgi:hypothetical protein
MNDDLIGKSSIRNINSEIIDPEIIDVECASWRILRAQRFCWLPD